LKNHWQRLLTELNYKDGEKIIDIGGGMDPVPIADMIVDIKNYGKGGKAYSLLDINCDRLPFADNEFDIAICCQTLEDLTCPKLILFEMQRVAKRGIIEVPHRGIESLKSSFPAEDAYRNLEVPKENIWCYGTAHHKWLIEEDNGLIFTIKCHYRLSKWPIPKWNGPTGVHFIWKDNFNFVVNYDIINSVIDKNYRDFKYNNRKYWE